MITAERLHQVVNYDPNTGVFTHKIPRKKVQVGAVAGCLDIQCGYIKLCIDGISQYAHRLAFLYMTGEMPKQCVDHKNGNRSDNRWSNLRDVPRQVNQQNMRHASSVSSSQLLGAYKKRGKFESKIRTPTGIVGLGSFDSAQPAHDAYIAAKRIHHEGCTI